MSSIVQFYTCGIIQNRVPARNARLARCSDCCCGLPLHLPRHKLLQISSCACECFIYRASECDAESIRKHYASLSSFQSSDDYHIMPTTAVNTLSNVTGCCNNDGSRACVRCDYRNSRPGAVYTMCLQIMVVTVGICRPYNKKQHLHNLHCTNVDIVHSQDVAMNDI